MVLGQQKRAVGILSTTQDVESALNELRDSGFSIEKIGVLAKDSGRHAHRSNTMLTENVAERSQEGATMGVIAGTSQGGLGGLLMGFGTLAIPGVGTTIAQETGGITLATILGDNGIGAFPDSWVRVLAGMGIPEKRTSFYSDRTERGDCLIMLEGTEKELAKAEQILSERGIQEWEIFDTPEADNIHNDNFTIKATERQVSKVSSQPNSPTNV